MACRLSSRTGVVAAQAEMTTLLDYLQRGSHLMRRELCSSSSSSSGSNSTSSMSMRRLFCSGRWPSSVAMAGPWSSWGSTAGAVRLNRKSRMTTGRQSAASGSITQEEVADVGTITMGQFIVQGLREEMEDEIVVEVDGPNGFSYAGVFDGHAGAFSAQFLRDELYKDCLSALEEGALLLSDNLHEAEKALSRAFLQTDKRLISRLESSEVVEEAESGSTATVLFARPDRLVLAYVGDCRAVLSRNGKAEDLTSDHRPFGREKKAFAETKRIQEAGGWVTHGRLCGTLSVSRAFGDIPFKLKAQKQKMLDSGIVEKRWNDRFAAEKNVDGEWLIATPDTTSMLLQDEVEFIIVASDGLWDSLKSADAVNFVRKRLKEHGDVQRATEEVGQEALNRGAQDNVSVIIVDFARVKADTGSSSWKFW